MTDFSHLSAATQEAVVLDNDERAEYIQSMRWLPYARANEILAKLEELYAHPKVDRMPSLFIAGRSDNGKTHILRRFNSLHPAHDNPEGRNVFAPVLFVEMPPSANEGAFYDAVLRRLCKRILTNQKVDEKRARVIDLLGEIETRVLVVDEMSNLLSTSPTRQRLMLNALKYISNILKISIVAAGTPEAMRAIQIDPQISSRLQLEPLPLWTYNTEFRKMLAGFETLLPLRFASELSSKQMATLIHSRSDGTIGSVAKLLNRAAIWAIENKVERIDAKVIGACGHRSEADRKVLAKHM